MTEPLPVIARKRPLAVLLLLCVIAWLPGFFTLPPLDRDESRFAQATKQMLESGDFVNINFGGAPRYEKPVGIYWLQSLSTAVLGAGSRDRIWTYRVPSLLGAMAAVAATFFIARAFAGAETAFFAGLILGLSVLLMSEAKIAKTDAVLLGAVATAQAVIMRTYLGARVPGGPALPGKPALILGWMAFGIGVLVKGPLIALVCLASIAAIVIWDREWRWLGALRPLTGLGVVLLMVLPWAVAIGIASHGLFYQKSLGQDFAMKLMGDQESHGAPPGYYTLLAPAIFWPGILVLLPAIVYGIGQRKDPAIRYLLAWAATTWLMFEFAPTKLPHYVLPAFPALSVLCALWICSSIRDSKAVRIGQWVSAALFVGVGLALAGFLAWAPSRFGTGTPWWLYAASGLCGLAVIAVVPPILARRRREAVLAAGLSAIMLYAVAGFATVPRLDALWLSPRLAEAVQRQARAGDPPVTTAGYAEPSIAFLLGTGTALDDGLTAAHAVGNAGGLALVSDDQQTSFLRELAKDGARADRLEEIDGFNYSRGKPAKITLYRVAPLH